MIGQREGNCSCYGKDEGSPSLAQVPISKQVYQEYDQYRNNASVVTFKDLATGEKVHCLAPKRGNKAYARKQKQKIEVIANDLEQINFEEPVPGHRTLIRTSLFFITLTFDQKAISAYEAWQHLTQYIKSFKIQLGRALGASSIDTYTVKEGTKGDYPAPHILLVVDNPVVCSRYNGKKGIKWIIQSREIHEKVKKAWKYGYLDIQGVKNNIVGGKNAIHYLTKYLTKSVDAEDTTSIAFRTHAWLKHFNQRASHLSKSFKERLARARLDTILHESQQEIEAQSHSWVFESVNYCELSDFSKVIMDLRDEKQENSQESPHSPQFLAWMEERKQRTKEVNLA